MSAIYLQAQVDDLERDKERLEYALDQIGFALAGEGKWDRYSRVIIEVLRGKTYSQALLAAPAMKEATNG